MRATSSPAGSGISSARSTDRYPHQHCAARATGSDSSWRTRRSLEQCEAAAMARAEAEGWGGFPEEDDTLARLLAEELAAHAPPRMLCTRHMHLCARRRRPLRSMR